MPIMTFCKGCGRRAQVANDSAGRWVRCSGCRATFRVPHGAGELTVEWGPFGMGRKFPILPDDDITIGRNRENLIQLLAPLVSRKHAVLTWNGREWRLRDLASSNGTFVNEQRVRDIGLTDGSRIVIGDFALRLSLVLDRPNDPESVLDAMALGESQVGMMAIVEPAEGQPPADAMSETLLNHRVVPREPSGD